MVLGIDIHPVYQEHINWAALDRNVRYIWLKVSDGGYAYRKSVSGRLYTPDSHAAGMKSTGAACGGYHYAQPSPSPETQADVLTRETVRLGLTSLAPALDLEAPFTPNAGTKDFAYRFLKRMKANGWNKVAIYSYTSMAQFLRPDTWDIPGLITWIARPAPVGQLGSYTGRTDVHQYTSAARIAGIQENVDANETLNNNLLGTALVEEEDMDYLILGRTADDPTVRVGNGIFSRPVADAEEMNNIIWVFNHLQDFGGKVNNPLKDMRVLGVDIGQLIGEAVNKWLDAHPPTVSVDVKAIADAVWAQARDNDASTGPTS